MRVTLENYNMWKNEHSREREGRLPLFKSRRKGCLPARPCEAAPLSPASRRARGTGPPCRLHFRGGFSVLFCGQPTARTWSWGVVPKIWTWLLPSPGHGIWLYFNLKQHILKKLALNGVFFSLLYLFFSVQSWLRPSSWRHESDVGQARKVRVCVHVGRSERGSSSAACRPAAREEWDTARRYTAHCP